MFLPEKVAVWLAFGNSVSSSKNSLKSGSVRKEAWDAVLFKNLSKAARRFSTNYNIKKSLSIMPLNAQLSIWIKRQLTVIVILYFIPHLAVLVFRLYFLWTFWPLSFQQDFCPVPEGWYGRFGDIWSRQSLSGRFDKAWQPWWLRIVTKSMRVSLRAGCERAAAGLRAAWRQAGGDGWWRRTFCH